MLQIQWNATWSDSVEGWNESLKIICWNVLKEITGLLLASVQISAWWWFYFLKNNNNMVLNLELHRSQWKSSEMSVHCSSFICLSFSACHPLHTRWQVRCCVDRLKVCSNMVHCVQQTHSSWDNSTCWCSLLPRDSHSPNRPAQESGSSFNKLKVDDIFRDQKRPCHGLHGNPFWVWLHIEIYEDLMRPEARELRFTEMKKKKNQCSSCASKCWVVPLNGNPWITQSN